jgi:hypothetical protein
MYVQSNIEAHSDLRFLDISQIVKTYTHVVYLIAVNVETSILMAHYIKITGPFTNWSVITIFSNMKTALYKTINGMLWTGRNETFWTLKNVVVSGSYTMEYGCLYPVRITK